MLFIFVPILAFILITLNILLSTNKPDDSKISPFECGFLSLTGQTRTNFDIQFYLVAMLFLVFDLEILLLFPIAVSLYQVSLFGFSIALIFFFVLTIGFILEIGSGAISLISKSTKNISNSNEKEINNITPFLNKQIISPMLIKQRKATFSTSAVYSKENLKDITTNSYWETIQEKDIGQETKNPHLKMINKNNNLSILNPWFTTGFIDGEGCFYVKIYKNNELKLGWVVRCIFSVILNERELPLLLQLQEFFGGIGKLSTFKKTVKYTIGSVQDLITIINHFDKYPLLTQKGADFILWKQIVELIINKEHLTYEGFQKIINIKASINLGLSDVLISNFSNIIPVERPLIKTKKIPNPNWIAGFTTGEGNFDVRIHRSSNKLGYQVQLRFRLTQHDRDVKLMELLTKYLNAGKIYKYPSQPAVSLTLTKFEDIINKIIPLFDTNQLHGVKQLDYLDWIKVVKLMKDKAHLTVEGIDLIRTIKTKMNSQRKLE